jgi:hypothetical protein
MLKKALAKLSDVIRNGQKFRIQGKLHTKQHQSNNGW